MEIWKLNVFCWYAAGLELVRVAIEKAGYTGRIQIGMDVAASEFCKQGKYDLDFKNPQSDPNHWVSKLKNPQWPEWVNLRTHREWVNRTTETPRIQIHSITQSKLCRDRIAKQIAGVKDLYGGTVLFAALKWNIHWLQFPFWCFWSTKYPPLGRLLNLSLSLRLVDVRSAVRCLQGIHWEVSCRVDWRRLWSGWLGRLDQNERSSRYSASWVRYTVAVIF